MGSCLRCKWPKAKPHIWSMYPSLLFNNAIVVISLMLNVTLYMYARTMVALCDKSWEQPRQHEAGPLNIGGKARWKFLKIWLLCTDKFSKISPKMFGRHWPKMSIFVWIMADHGGFKFIAYVLTIFWHIYSSLINMRCLHILPHI